MSLINQMLKDIDRRQGDGGPLASASLGMARPVSSGRPSALTGVWLLLGLLLLAGGGTAVYVWRKKPEAAPLAPVTAAVSVVPASPAVQTPSPPPEAAQPVSAMQTPVTSATPEPVQKNPTLPEPAKAEKALKSSGKAVAQMAEPATPKASPAQAVVASESAAKVQPPPQSVAAGQVTRVLSAEQRADNAYRDATQQLRQGHPLEAQKHLQQALADQPAHLDARLLYAQLLWGEGRAEPAKALLTEGIVQKPQAFALYSALAQMQLLARDADQAVTTLERGLSAAGDNAAYHALLATALQQQSRHAEAIQHYVMALRQQPDSSNWLVGLGVSLQAQGNLNGAAEAYQRALDLGLPAALSQYARERLLQVSR